MRQLTLKVTLAVVTAIVLACRLTEGCSGRKVLNGQKGIISDGPTEYPHFAQCEWLIEAGGSNKFIHLDFKSMSTECSFDFLFVYDGNSYSSHLLASLSGDSPPDTLIAKSGYMLLYLFSDRNYMKDGFEARYTVLDCPKNCSNNGKCINHTCHCVDYYGEACDKLRCPDNCSNHGNCTATSPKGKTCVCEEGFIGPDCGVSTDNENGSQLWNRVTADDEAPPRTAHTGVFQPSTNCLWIFGGFNLNNVLNDLIKFCFKDNKWSNIAAVDPWPSPRKGHAAAGVTDGFYVYGGSSLNDTLNDELWFYNTTYGLWELMAINSTVKPRALTGHTLSNVDDEWLYMFGGKTAEVTASDVMYKLKIPAATQWEIVRIRGGNFPLRRLIGHSTVYHRESRSLIVFGGYSQTSRLVSTRTNELNMFNIDDGFWSKIHNKNLDDSGLPFPRAFHTAVIMGNYMVVYGGNTHKHHHLEICYNSDLYLYHLGCHVWQNDTMGYLKPTKGRFGHIAAVANSNQLIVMGGYSGQVRSDLLIYKVSPAIARHETVVLEDMDHCLDYSKDETCLKDPDCVYCKTARLDSGKPGCVHRTRTDMCSDGNIQDLKSQRCPGICAVLSTCSACVSQGKGVNLTASQPRRRVYNDPCSWCVKQAVCQTRAVPQGTCLAAENTSSGIQGWWEGLSASLTTHQQCQLEDYPAGLHWIEYRFPMNKTYPDHLSIVRQTEQTLKFRYNFMSEIENDFTYTGRMIGFIHPLNAPPPPGKSLLRLHMKMRGGQTSLYLSRTNVTVKPELVLSLSSQMKYNDLFSRN
ncbi:multiple epidermal growth factor-like domains protein 8 [Patella vulgata]|uniref:multiple epidermal growth factor-like domains protein 8 n=1 Tax=Patella vulgata TaxID=6465 RepID=UPI0024A84A72|nr:multiple epidermal growth factor-like domains protein 8 [Patella vulgata]